MSYTVSGSGHGVDNESAKKAFAEFVRALDEGTDLDKKVEGWADPTLFQGSIGGGHAEGTFTLTADQVRSEEAES
jgi:hypothetical protein